MEIWIWISIAAIAGALIGGGLVWLLGGNRSRGASAAALEKENERFKAEVTDHFVETARLINQMTDSYKAVFDHLSGGAQRLVDPKDLSQRLEVEHREVRLHRIGASERPNAPGSSPGSTPGSTPDSRSAASSAASAQAKSAGKTPAPRQESGLESNDRRSDSPGEKHKDKSGTAPKASNRDPDSDPLKTRPARPAGS